MTRLEALQSGLEKSTTLSVDNKFLDFEEIAKIWSKKAYSIVVNDETQLETIQKAKEGRLLLKNKRAEIEKTRKSLKEKSLLEGRYIDSVAKKLTSLIKPAEEHLLLQEKYIEIKEENRKNKLKEERLLLLEKYNDFFDANFFDLKTMSEVAFTTVLNGCKLAYENNKKEEEAKRLEEEENLKKINLYQERKNNLLPYSFFIKSGEQIWIDSTEEEYNNFLSTLKQRKQKSDDEKQLLEKQNAELKKKVVNTEKKIEVVSKKSKTFEDIAQSNANAYKSELETLRKQNNEMQIVLKNCLNFIIPDRLRKVIESTLKELKNI